MAKTHCLIYDERDKHDGIKKDASRFRISYRKSNLSILFGAFTTISALFLFVFLIAFLASRHRLPSSDAKNIDILVCEASHETYAFSLNLTIKNYKRFSIAVDNAHCSNVGKNILMKNGSAVDAAIAAGLCNGLMNAQSAGIGGGHFMVIYLKDKKKAYAINARETAPASSFENMFFNKSSLKGGLASAIPGEVYGYWEAHKLAGRLPWKELFQPAIDMCHNGFKINRALANAIKASEHDIRDNKALSDIFINKNTNEIFKLHDQIKMPKLARTLEMISEENIGSFYDSDLTKLMVKEMNQNGANVTLEDFKHFRAEVSEPISVDLDNDYKLLTSSIPSSGVLVSFIMRLMRGFHLDSDVFENRYKEALFYHRLIESFKHAFAHRSRLGDEPDNLDIAKILENVKDEKYIDEVRSKISDYETHPSSFYSKLEFKEDHGTAHISVLADGDAVSFTSTLNTYFGAKYSGQYTGIIYNNQMDDFSTPNLVNYFGLEPSKANYIKPYKRPMSSMAPIIIVDSNGDVRLVLGASGGSKIITSVAQVAIKTLWLDRDIKEAIDERRVHHQIYPEYIQIEEGFDLETQKLLKVFGHNQSCFEYGGSIVQGIDRRSMFDIYAYSDARKGGIPDGH